MKMGLEVKTKVKICGITNLSDALSSAELGADMLGFNFYERSPRYVTQETARKIVGRLDGGISKVGVFVNESIGNIVRTAEAVGLDALQLHGDETVEFVKELKSATTLLIIKAFRISNDISLRTLNRFPVDAVLIDTYSPDEFGGTGESFDWGLIKNASRELRIYLAGGLGPDNVSAAIKATHPYAVDACSRLEIEKGKKDAAKVKAFIREAREAR